MESSKLKNIVLIILLVTNLLLLLLLGTQRWEHRQSETQALNSAVELLAEKGISLNPDILPRGEFAAPLSVEPDAAGEKDAFSALLGPSTALTQRGLVAYYTGPLGEAELREDGSFSLSLSPGQFVPQGESPAEYAQGILRRIGFEGTVLSADADSVTILQMQDGAPVFSCQAKAVYQDGSLVSVVGRRLSGKVLPAAGQPAPLSLATLLVRFRSGIIESGDACSAILETTQGYLLSDRSGSTAQLVPVLLVVSDANRYYVNALTGSLQRA